MNAPLCDWNVKEKPLSRKNLCQGTSVGILEKEFPFLNTNPTACTSVNFFSLKNPFWSFLKLSEASVIKSHKGISSEGLETAASSFMLGKFPDKPSASAFKGSVEWSRHERHFCSLLPYFLLSWLQVFQLCLSFWTSSFDMVLLKNSFRKKKNIWKTTQNALAPSIFIVWSIVLKLGTPLLHIQAQNTLQNF